MTRRRGEGLVDLRLRVAESPLHPVASLVVGVGIEPTFRAFQTRANPSQLSDPDYFRFKIEDFRLLLPNYRPQSEIIFAVHVQLSREHLDRHAYP